MNYFDKLGDLSSHDDDSSELEQNALERKDDIEILFTASANSYGIFDCGNNASATDVKTMLLDCYCKHFVLYFALNLVLD